MRLSLPAIALSVCVSPFGLAASGPSGDVAKTASPKGVPATAAPPSSHPPGAPAYDTAARHAQIPALPKMAKPPKLAGDQNNSLLNRYPRHLQAPHTSRP